MISDSDKNKSYRLKIDEMINRHTLSLAEWEWVQFLMDHREEILEKHSTIVEVTQEELYRFRYRLSDYLNEKFNMLKGEDQCTRIINRFYNDLDFNLTVSKLYIPDQNYLEILRKEYQTVQAKKKKI